MKNLIVLFILLWSCPLWAADIYWVDTNGAASWGSCESDSELSGTAACSMSTANSNATAGDTVNIQGGTYNTSLSPSNSGSVGNVLTFQAYNSETVTITNTTYGLRLQYGKDYIKIDGITFDADSGTLERILLISSGCDYNELVNCAFLGKGTVDKPKIWDGTGYLPETGIPCTNNWIHDCDFIWDSDDACYDDVTGLQIGTLLYDYHSDNNTVEDCTFSYGGHHNLETYSHYNVIRNNFFHNEDNKIDAGGCTCDAGDVSGKYGNRNLSVYCSTAYDPAQNLIESNRIGKSGHPVDDDGGENFVAASPENIIRYNDMFMGASTGFCFKIGSGGIAQGDDNRFYNNTLAYNGYGDQDDRGSQPTCGMEFYGLSFWSDDATGNIVKNNIFYGNEHADYGCKSNSNCLSLNTVSNNYVNADGDPYFVDDTVSDPTSTSQPDFALLGASGALDAATYLTQANGGGSSSTTLIVDDALYFQDGSWGSSLSTIAADYIIISSSATDASGGSEVQISSINYDTDTITLASAQTWSDNDYIFLGKISDGTDVLIGTLPDYGAHETESGGAVSGSVIADVMSESDLVAGGETIVIDIINDTLIADISSYRQELIDSFTSAQSESNGWNNEIIADEVVTAIVRTDSDTITWTLTANGDYAITANETIGASAYIPNEILTTATEDIPLSPTFIISNENPGAENPVIGIGYSATGGAGEYSATGQAVSVPQ